jgi:hypothetical protein
MAQIFDIFGREFKIRHVTPFPGCIRAAGFGDQGVNRRTIPEADGSAYPLRTNCERP